jgi:LysM repeat protein
MKSNTLPIKRCPAPQGIFKRLSAVTRNRKQRVAATASAADFEEEDGGSRISKALIIIFLVHIVAIGLIFFHQRFLDGRPNEEAMVNPKAKDTMVASPAPTQEKRLDLPRLASGEKPYIVRTGDNYTRIALAEGVDEADLRLINRHVNIRPGLVLKVPPKRIVAIEPEEVTALRAPVAVPVGDGMVDVAVPPLATQQAQLVRPSPRQPATLPRESPSSVVPSGKTYTVQAGDSIWRIANRFKVDQAQLMKANSISDARKVRTGMNLVIPR